MTNILGTNAPLLPSEEGDIDYDLPDAPLFLKMRFEQRGDDYDLVYIAYYPGGVWAEFAAIRNELQPLVGGFL